MSRGEVVALADLQTALLLGLGNGKAGNLCRNGVQLFGVNLQFNMGVCEFGQTHYRFYMAAAGEEVTGHCVFQLVATLF